MKHRTRRAAALCSLCLLAAAIASCGPPPSPGVAGPPDEVQVGAAGPPHATPPAPLGTPSTGSPDPSAAPPGRPLGVDRALGRDGCHLPAPLKSDDPCTSDADCGVSSPCHAKACVAVAKSRPRGPHDICTEVMACDTADANRCGCYEGRCALIPPSP